MGLRCKRCRSEDYTRNGRMRGRQRYRCKACGLNFTDTPPRGKSFALQLVAELLYVNGLSMNRTAKLLGVSTPTVRTWIERFAKSYVPKPEPQRGRVVVMRELDNIWLYIRKGPTSTGSSRLGIVLGGDLRTESAAVVIELP